MIDITITQAQRDEWQQSIDMLARIAQCGAALLQVDQDDKFVPLCYANINLELLDKLQLTREQVYRCSPTQSHDLSASSLADKSCETLLSLDTSIQCLLPINWPAGALFGYICISPRSEVSPHSTVPSQAKQTETRQILKLCADSIELGLAESYRQFKRDKSRTPDVNPLLSQVSLQAFIDCMKEHVWLKDTSGRYILVNQSVVLDWNRSPDQILTLTDDELFEPRLAKHFIAGDMESIRKGVLINAGECEGLDIGDVDTWLETTKAPIIADDGELIGVIGISRNISSHKAAREQLELASRVFENSVEGVIITDVDGAIIDAHGAFNEITGYTKEELLGQNPRVLNSGRHEQAFFTKMWNDLLSKGKWHGEIWNRRKSGAIFPQMLNISAVYDVEHQIRFFVAVFNDISAQKQSEAELAKVAFHDPLTKLPNRMALNTGLEQELKQASHNNTRLGLVYIDVDLFKQINESYGHPIGDEVLLEVSRRFSQSLGDLVTVARLGSDEFALLLPNIDSNDGLLLQINNLRKVFDQPFILGEFAQARLTASMGVAIYPDDAQDSSGLLVNAEVAMHRAKQDGRNNCAFYTESLNQESVAKLKLQSALHDAIEINALHLVYQPKVSFVTGDVVGFEALLRWDDPAFGAVSPAVFIPLAEKIGLIQDIGRWVLKRACEQGQRWHQQGVSFGRIAVNVAGQQIQRSSFVDEVVEILKETGLPATSLELEVTESCMMSDPELVSQDLAKLGELGVELSIDDFGTGYSSLSYLKKLPIHKLKIDQSFVAGLPLDTHNTAIAKAIIAMGHALNLKVVAEGVETQAQADFLKASQCDHAQGYFYSKPKRVEELSAFLNTSS